MEQRLHCCCAVFFAISLLIAPCFASIDEDDDAAADAAAADRGFINSTYDPIDIDTRLFLSNDQLIELQDEWWKNSDEANNISMNNNFNNNNENQRWYSGGGCRSTGNPIDDCWRCDPRWHQHRKRLSDCAIGFGRGTTGGRSGAFYVVTDASDDDPVKPRPGTLRYGVVQDAPLWIVFARDMVIRLSQELIVNSRKTIDGRGANVRIAHGACLTVQYVSDVIVHGIFVHDCRRTGPAMVRSSPTHVGWRTIADGDGISLFGARNVWIDHCFLARCSDGLIDAIVGSTGITISNSYFTSHNKVMLLGHSDSYTSDRVMQVTIAYNHFGEGLVQRMPRCRLGYFHIVNNHYTHWQMYAIGGSANPTINSQGNRFIAPPNPFSKQVTKREFSTQQSWMKWNWRSEGDSFVNGAYFRPSGAGSSAVYAKASSLSAKPASLVPILTASAGPLKCSIRGPC